MSYDKERWLKAVQESGAAVPEAVSCKNFMGDEAFQIFVTEADITIEGRTLRGVLVEKWVFDTDDTSAVDHVDELSLDVWEVA